MPGRRLKELLAADLRKELERRNLDFTGTKQVMLERLKEALKEEGADPETWRLEPPKTDEETPQPDSVDGSKGEPENEVAVNSTAAVQNPESQDAEDNKESFSQECTQKDLPTADEKADADVEMSAPVETNKDVPDVPGQGTDQNKTSRPSSPALDCQLIVSMADGTSELDRELMDFNQQEEKKEKTALGENTEVKESCGGEEKASESMDNKETACKGSNSVWVNNIAPTTKAINLKTLFSKYGKVLVARIVRKSYPGGSKLCGFVTMASAEEADEAICGLHKRTVDDHVIFCVRGDNKRTEDILAKRKLPRKIESTKVTSFLAKRPGTPKGGSGTDPIGEGRPPEKLVSTRRDPVSASQMMFIERKTQMLKALERRVRRREFELKQDEAKLKDLERQNHTKAKELEVEREVLRDARNRFARERVEFERRNEAKVAELRAYEQRLVRAETELRAAQEQQQRYYETERLRQQRLAYDEEMRKRQEMRRPSRREKSLSPRRRSSVGRREESPKRSYRRHPQERDNASAERFWPSSSADRSRNATGQMSGSSYNDSSRISRQSFPQSRMMPLDRDSTPPRKLKKSVDYRGGRYEGPVADRPGEADTDMRRSDLNRYPQPSGGDYSWRQQRTSSPKYSQNYSGRMKQSDGSQPQGPPPPPRRPMAPIAGPRFDAYTLMMNEMAAFAARAGGAALSAFSPRYSSNPYSQQPPPQQPPMDRQRFG